MNRPVRAAVLSAGSWGTAMSKILGDAGTDVVLHARRPAVAEAINLGRHNPSYFPDVVLPDRVRATTDPADALDGADLLVLSIPTQHLRENLAAWKPLLPPEVVVVSLMKGIELSTGLRASQVISETTGLPADRVAVISGPNLARELVDEQPAATAVACPDETVARYVQAAIHGPYFRPYTSTDVLGAEISGAMKNVIALAVGIATGQGMGHNTAALLITRGLAETTRLATALGAAPATLAGLAGLGDLVATCTSPLSRNRTFGQHLGRGLSPEQAAIATRQTTEGVKTARAVLDLAHAHGVDLPITATVVALLDGHLTAPQAAHALMGRPTRPER
ncbi:MULTISPECIES: NAD(P)H-dependent glycerol-3-phosphate dehydrogenase [Actinosynnema]|uniref:NAD(P)H-dependent glycerol-3-phosphate dehydrogenase n=1 Tax=Actinosynnema TaxID=40566 RepID=UPI0020A60918|nr:NAD(P)H-dependent glycerol-3-phosphate dehydrogenase [Actinosynnema pretiosum]MCP2097283.1 glycerol-3-phosphate dehydrogenase (NAD(P)+) [Actinosynnema pretiosum]